MDQQNSTRPHHNLSAVLCREKTHRSNAVTEQLACRLGAIERTVAALRTRMDGQFVGWSVFR